MSDPKVGIGRQVTNFVDKITPSPVKKVLNAEYDKREKINNKKPPVHKISEELQSEYKGQGEKKLITNILDFLNKMETQHQSFNVRNKKNDNNISVNNNKDLKDKDNTTANGGMKTTAGKAFINNKVRNLDNDYYHKLPFL